MALIKCRECGKNISDEASSCPHCGAPIKLDEVYNEKEEKIVTVKVSKFVIIMYCILINALRRIFIFYSICRRSKRVICIYTSIYYIVGFSGIHIQFNSYIYYTDQ